MTRAPMGEGITYSVYSSGVKICHLSGNMVDLG